VELTPEAFSIIEAQAYLSGRNLKSVASEIISEHCSEEAKRIANLKAGTTKEPNDQMIIKADDQKVKKLKSTKVRKPKVEKAEGSKKRASKKKSPEVLQLIKEAWGRTPRPTLRKIAEEVEASLGVGLSHTAVKRYAEELGLQAEETEPETANVGE